MSCNKSLVGQNLAGKFRRLIDLTLFGEISVSPILLQASLSIQMQMVKYDNPKNNRSLNIKNYKHVFNSSDNTK